jgi:endonuclease/exonuclease/phosphatase family metal-dependent hydrolase
VKLLAFLLLLSSFLFGDKTLTIATYNVENLFDLNKNGYEYEEYIPNTQSNWNQRTYKIKLKNISKVIQSIDADIIALQEIESLQALKDLRFTLKTKGLYYPYYKIADKKNTTIKVAILSKIPFVYNKEVTVTSSYKYRNILESKFSINGKDLYIFTNHWKSKSGSESQRIIAAKALRKRLQELGYDKNIILLGDFNSDYEEYKKFLRKRKHNDTGGKTGINHVLKSKNQQQKASQTTLIEKNFYNLWYDENIKERWTYIFRGEKEALDNILISQALLNNKGIHYKYNSIHSYKPSYLLKGKSINRWKTTWKKPRKHKGKGYSDHLPVIAKFIIPSNTN